MKRTTLFSLGFLLLVTLIFYRPVFAGSIPVPTDTLVNLFHPYRDYFASTNPRGVPYKNPLVGDPVTQIIPWKMLSLSEIAQGNLPLWNPYQMAGYPLLGNIQSSPFYPLNVLLGLLPFLAGWTIFIMLQQILASLWMYLYLKNRKLSELSSVLGALAFSFSGFFISWLEWGTILHTALWLPLSLLAVDKLVDSGRRRWNIVLIICFICSFLGGHLQTFIYTQVVLVAYVVYSFLFIKKDWRLLLSTAVSLFVGLLIILPVALPQLQLLLLSARNIDQSYHQAGWFIPLPQIIQFIAPDFFGNPATGNYWGVF